MHECVAVQCEAAQLASDAYGEPHEATDSVLFWYRPDAARGSSHRLYETSGRVGGWMAGCSSP